MPPIEGPQSESPASIGLELHFFYLLPFVGDIDVAESPFQRFSHGLLNREDVLRLVARLPCCIQELVATKELARRCRAAGLIRHAVTPLDAQYLGQMLGIALGNFAVVFSFPDTFEAVDGWVSSQECRPLHVSVVRSTGVVPFERLTRARLRQYARQVSEFRGDTELVAKLRENVGWKARTWLPFPRTDHNTCFPSENALIGVGFGFRTQEYLHPDVNRGIENYEYAMSRLAQKIQKMRALDAPLGWPVLPGLIVACPGLNRVAVKELVRKKTMLSRADAAGVQEACRLLRDQTEYYFRMNNPDLSDTVRGILSIRANELGLLTAGIAIRASSEFAAVYRVSPRVDQCWAALKRVGDCHRALGSSGTRLRKLKRELASLRSTLTEACGEALQQQLRVEPNAVRLVSDVPLEWLPTDEGLPLMLGRETSRIPTLPGNVALQHLVPRPPIVLSVDDFSEVLIIRSFDAKDPVRQHLAIAMGALAKQNDKFWPRIVDVGDEDAVARALNEYRGAVLIYDGHGGHNETHGTLKIGNADVDIWNLTRNCRVPPIVLLSACDTLPIDRSYASVAAGFLAGGARTVIGSLLPIHASHAGVFAFRLMHAALAMVPALLGSVPAVRWSRVFTRTLRSQLMTELCSYLLAEELVTMHQLEHGQRKATLACALGYPDWYQRGLSAISEASGQTVDELQRILDERIVLPECYLYSQLGDPESILIRAQNAEPDTLRE